MILQPLSELSGFVSQVVAAFGVIVLALNIYPAARLTLGVVLALDFWLAAGLLKLTGTPSWTLIVGVAVIIAIRKLVGGALRKRVNPKKTSLFGLGLYL